MDQSVPVRWVTNRPNREGLYELGPCSDGAHGLGDTITIAPLAKALGKKAVMIMPQRMAQYAFIFNGLCPTRISEDFPEFKWMGRRHAAAQKLDLFGFRTLSHIPEINVRQEYMDKAHKVLANIPNPIAFCPTCSAKWEHMRQRLPIFWRTIVPELAKRFTVLQFGRAEYPLVAGARRMPFFDFEMLAAFYKIIGNLVCVNTGDYHLMTAVGGRVISVEPDPLPPGHMDVWCYHIPRVVHAKLSHPQTVLEAIRAFPL